jgi:hypothetical protein
MVRSRILSLSPNGNQAWAVNGAMWATGESAILKAAVPSTPSIL